MLDSLFPLIQSLSKKVNFQAIICRKYFHVLKTRLNEGEKVLLAWLLHEVEFTNSEEGYAPVPEDLRAEITKRDLHVTNRQWNEMTFAFKQKWKRTRLRDFDNNH